MIYPKLDPQRNFRLCLGSALLFLTVGLILMGALVWYFAEWGLAEVSKAPTFDDGKPFEIWDFLGAVFVSSMIAPLLGLGYDPFLRFLAVKKDIPLSPPLAVIIALPFWYVAFLPTYMICLHIIDEATRTVLLFAPSVCALLTGLLHLVMIQYAIRNMAGPKSA